MFHELALIPTFLLIGIWGSGDRQAAAWKVTTYLAFGSFILLIGLIGLYLSLPESDRTFDMRRIAELAARAPPNPAATVYICVLFSGFGILGFPLSVSHVGSAGLRFRARTGRDASRGRAQEVWPLWHSSPDHCRSFRRTSPSQFNTLLLVLVLGNILYVGLVTISQRKLDLMLGYASVMHMGYFSWVSCHGRPSALAGAALMLVAHGLSIAALFALSGELRERTGTLDFAELGGLAKAMPTFGLLFGFAAMAAVGLPGFANFAAELMIFFGAFSAGVPAKSGFNEFQIAAVVGGVGRCDLSGLSCFRSYRRIFMGPIGDKWKTLPDIATLSPDLHRRAHPAARHCRILPADRPELRRSRFDVAMIAVPPFALEISHRLRRHFPADDGLLHEDSTNAPSAGRHRGLARHFGAFIPDRTNAKEHDSAGLLRRRSSRLFSLSALSCFRPF